MAVQRVSLEQSDLEATSSEKMNFAHTEQANIGHFQGLKREDAEFLANFSEASRKKVIRKIDLRLVPVLLVLYLLAYLDKTNIGNAVIEGILPDLKLTGNQYNIALSIFFIPYVLAEVPSNMILNKFKRPSYYIATLVLLWGIVMTCTGFINHFGELCAIRFLLGLFEAGFFPGAILLISKWYLPDETQTRIALLYTSAASGGAFSGLLAFGLAKMSGIGGYRGWRWIFIMEGLATVVMGIACFFILVDSPALSSGWLTPDEIRYLELRQLVRHKSQSSEKPQSSLSAFWAVASDWKMYFLILANWSQAVPNYAMKFTMPTIVKSMGFTSATAQLLTIPPYACGAISAYVLSLLADRFRWRAPFIVGPQCCVVVAFTVLFTKAADIQNNIALCYFCVCLACFGMYPIFPGVNAWNVANQAGPTKRAVSIGYLVCAGNIGGVVGSYIYKADEAPKYPTGYGNSLAFGAAGLVSVLALEYFLHRRNEANALLSDADVRAKYSDEQLERMGDRSPLFKYQL
ncbi:major facilitator superfamily transporter [Coniochaeta sp. 2T2.1]|nr:major facilitator superfamily transporter [Coniochaeta sp. 2T2.1]